MLNNKCVCVYKETEHYYFYYHYYCYHCWNYYYWYYVFFMIKQSYNILNKCKIKNFIRLFFRIECTYTLYYSGRSWFLIRTKKFHLITFFSGLANEVQFHDQFSFPIHFASNWIVSFQMNFILTHSSIWLKAFFTFLPTNYPTTQLPTVSYLLSPIFEW